VIFSVLQNTEVEALLPRWDSFRFVKVCQSGLAFQADVRCLRRTRKR